MRTFAFAAAFVASAVAGVLAQAPTINTPTSVVVCQPVALTFSGGTAPYYISVLPGGQVSAAPLVNLNGGNTIAASPFTWVVNIPAGTAISLQIKDSTGLTNYAQQVTVQPGTSTACLTAGTTSGAATGTTTAMTTLSSSASMAAISSMSSMASSASVSSASMASMSMPSSASSKASSAAPSASSAAPAAASSGAAVANAGAGSVLGLVGLAVVALVA